MTFSRRVRIGLYAVGGCLSALALLAATFPVGWLKNRVELQLSEQTGSPVSIGGLDREERFSFRLVVRVTDLHIAQPRWAGRGQLASAQLVRLRVSLFPLLTGTVRAELLTAQGVALNLVRDAQGHVNWRKDKGEGSDGGTISMSQAQIDQARISYRDALQKRSAILMLRLNPRTGLIAEGTGEVDGAAIRLHASGGPLVPDRSWAFDGRLEGQSLAMRATGTMAAPLRSDDMNFHVSAKADDLKRIDRIIEAGLFGTQSVQLEAQVRRHTDATWTITELRGTIGNSDLTGRLTAHKRDGRMKLDGDVHFAHLNFEDLASDSGNAKAIALERAEGLRLVPNTRINIHKIDKTDGRIAVKIDQVTGGRRPSSIRSISGVLTIDNRILTVEPLRIGLSQGMISGKAIVDQRAGQAKPKVTLALDMTASSIVALAGGGNDEIDGRVDARVRLTGSGDTIREAVGHSDGTIGVTARSGALPSRIAALMGFDIGKGLIDKSEGQASLRCAALRLDMRNGRGLIDPLLIDTSLSQTRGTGMIGFPAEALSITLTGAPKGDVGLRLPGSISAAGTIREPQIIIPKKTKSFGNVLKAIGRAIEGKSGPKATDADCAALRRRAIGR